MTGAEQESPVTVSPIPVVSREQLVTENLALVDYVVSETMQRLPRHVSRDDLVSAGMAALAQAAAAFDPARGVPFPRYASTRIRGALIDELTTSAR